MNLLHTLSRAIRVAFGHRFLDITEDRPDRLVLQYGQTTTVFDKTASRIEQNGRLTAVLDLVERIELHQPTNQSGPPNWYITVHVRGARQVEVGQLTDETDASVVGARISKLTGRPVVVNPW